MVNLLHRALIAALMSPLLVVAPGSAQESSLAGVYQALQPCLDGGRAKACPAALKAVDGLQASAAYARADILCKQQMASFRDVVALMAIRDSTPIEAQASFDAMAQACASLGL